MTFLLSARAAAVDAIFSDGFEDGACVWSSAVAADACGPGHLVLIGHDYTPAGVPRGAASEGTTTLTRIEQVLVDAVAQSHATTLPRATRLAVLDENAASDELAHVSAVLAGAFTLETEVVALAGVPAALGHSDVLLIPDQNGFFADGGATTVAAELAPSLRTFLEAGGVVVVLDGTYELGDTTLPSKTYRVLDPDLLDIEAASSFEGCVEVPCNEADPVLGGVASATCGLGHTVAFASDEPWVALAYRQPGLDQAFVLHRWFGKTDSGPIAFDLDTGPGDLSGSPVFFQDAGGQSVAQCATLSNGTAVHQMGADSFVSVGLNSGSRQLVTVVGAQPLDHLVFQSQDQLAGSPFEATANLPGEYAGAGIYRVMLGCDSSLSGNLAIAVATTSACANPDGSYSLVAEALDPAGRLLAYTIANGVTDATPQPVAMPAWKVVNFFPAVTGSPPSGLLSIEIGVRLSTNGGVDYIEGGGPVSSAPGSGTFPFYSDPGVGQPPFAALTHRERLRFTKGATSFVPTSERNERGPLLESFVSDYVNDFLPRLSNLSIGFDPGQRLKVDWAIAAPAPSADGGTAQTSWNRDFLIFQWVLVFPPGTTSLLAPPNPGGDGDLFWPNPDLGDGVSLNQLRLDDATFLPSYRAYRQDILGVTRPPMAPYVLRSTQLAPVP